MADGVREVHLEADEEHVEDAAEESEDLVVVFG